ncbi:hypothetical protein [Campylobacter concisus]|uniref:hypothetical protein n=1 Tax=Campylobacter concisus TaxID=199 RepID=UPI00131BEC1F|nr:hypothetical protein [Campylobacter concisus]
MIKFELDDAESYKLEFGDKFYLPECEKRQNLRTGDEIKFNYKNVLEIYKDDEN